MNPRKRQEIPTDAATRYEVALMRGDKVIEILGYTARKTKQGITDQFKGKDLLKFFTKQELESRWKYSSKTGISFNNSMIRACFTGRTEREAASNV